MSETSNRLWVRGCLWRRNSVFFVIVHHLPQPKMCQTSAVWGTGINYQHLKFWLLEQSCWHSPYRNTGQSCPGIDKKTPHHFSRIWASWALFPAHVALSVSKVQHSCISCMDCHVPRSLSDWAFFGWKIVKCTFLQTNYLSLRKAMNNSEWETDLRTLQSAHKQEKFLWINNWLGIILSIPLVTKSFSKEELAYRETTHRYAAWIEYLNLNPWRKILLFIEQWTRKRSKYSPLVRNHEDAQLCYQSWVLTGNAECRYNSGGIIISLHCSTGINTLLLQECLALLCWLLSHHCVQACIPR